jgi:tetratricopeptide (TPR) repeat protein
MITLIRKAMTGFYVRLIFFAFLMLASVFAFSQDEPSTLSTLYPTAPASDKPYEIISDLNRKLADDPENSDLLASRAIQYSRVNDYDYAFRDMKKAISLSPNDHSLYYKLALIHYRKKAYIDAIIQLNIALDLSPNNEDYLFLRSMSFSMNKQYIEAVNDADAISAVNPYNTDIYLLCGKLYERLGLYYYSFKSYFLFLKYEETDKANINLVNAHLKKMKKKDKYFSQLMKKAKKEVFSKKSS